MYLKGRKLKVKTNLWWKEMRKDRIPQNDVRASGGGKLRRGKWGHASLTLC